MAAPPSALGSISVSPTNVSIAVGSTVNLNATGTYADGSTANITSQVTWTSTNAGVANAGSNTGIITGATVGTSNISATLIGLTSPVVSVTVVSTGGIAASSNALSTARNDHTASLLGTGVNSGKVLAVGGYGISSVSTPLNALNSVEMYDPANDSWSLVTPLISARGDHTSVILPDGRVLVTGGTDSNSKKLTSTELYDPSTSLGTWTSSCDLLMGRSYNTITLLSNGKVLVAGGDGSAGTTNTAEVYDPTVATTPCRWTQVGNMSQPRNTPTATLLNDGTVLVAGGFNVTGQNLTVFSSSELFNPNTNAWSRTTGSLTDGRYQHTATLLNNGKVLVAGGYNAGNPPLATAELYDPSTGLWTPTGSLATARAIHTATLLSNGKVLVMGGLDSSGNPLASTEIYDPSTGIWTTTGNLLNARDNFTATLLLNGKVLAAGGDGVTSILSGSELYW